MDNVEMLVRHELETQIADEEPRPRPEIAKPDLQHPVLGAQPVADDYKCVSGC